MTSLLSSHAFRGPPPFNNLPAGSQAKFDTRSLSANKKSDFTAGQRPHNIWQNGPRNSLPKYTNAAVREDRLSAGVAGGAKPNNGPNTDHPSRQGHYDSRDVSSRLKEGPQHAATGDIPVHSPQQTDDAASQSNAGLQSTDMSSASSHTSCSTTSALMAGSVLEPFLPKQMSITNQLYSYSPTEQNARFDWQSTASRPTIQQSGNGSTTRLQTSRRNLAANTHVDPFVPNGQNMYDSGFSDLAQYGTANIAIHPQSHDFRPVQPLTGRQQPMSAVPQWGIISRPDNGHPQASHRSDMPTTIITHSTLSGRADPFNSFAGDEKRNFSADTYKQNSEQRSRKDSLLKCSGTSTNMGSSVNHPSYGANRGVNAHYEPNRFGAIGTDYSLHMNDQYDVDYFASNDVTGHVDVYNTDPFGPLYFEPEIPTSRRHNVGNKHDFDYTDHGHYQAQIDYSGQYGYGMNGYDLSVAQPYAGPPTDYMTTTPTSYSGNRGNEQTQLFRSAILEEYRIHFKTRKYELKEIYGHIVEFSGDQHGSRFIQHQLEIANSEEKDRVFREIEQDSRQLMTDVFGNYVIQKMFEHGNQAQKRALADHMRGHMLTLSTQMYGCRVVQKALDHILTDQQASLIRELEGNVLRVVGDQNGNHVIQKAIECVPGEHIQFIVEAHRGKVHEYSKHTYGCRVIQRMLEYCTPQAKRIILDELHQNIGDLIQDAFGNYVVQHVITNGEPRDRRPVIEQVYSRLVDNAKHKFASNVVEKALDYAEDGQRQKMLATIVGPGEDGQNQVRALLGHQYGNYVIQKCALYLTGPLLGFVLEEMDEHLTQLRRVSAGKQVMAMEKTLRAARFRANNLHANNSSSHNFVPTSTRIFA